MSTDVTHSLALHSEPKISLGRSAREPWWLVIGDWWFVVGMVTDRS
jgi:hypothetical protein